MEKKITLWGKRYSVARGYFWQAEREVSKENAEQWLEVFQKDEPNVLFRVSIRKPRI